MQTNTLSMRNNWENQLLAQQSFMRLRTIYCILGTVPRAKKEFYCYVKPFPFGGEYYEKYKSA